jgi:hypothetical protein
MDRIIEAAPMELDYSAPLVLQTGRSYGAVIKKKYNLLLPSNILNQQVKNLY